jgi:hypothetical protein
LTHLATEGFECKQCDGDADTLIVSTALDLAAVGESVTVIAEDTDILIMLAHHLTADMNNVTLVSEVKKSRKYIKRSIDIRALQNSIGGEVCEQLLAIHALGGCDTTSALFGVGKATVYKCIIASRHSRQRIAVMQDLNATEEGVVSAGLKLLVWAYGGNDDDRLDKMCFSVYSKMVSSSVGNLMPQKLPPTERAAYYHVQHCHHQAVTWKHLSTNIIDPLKWGWKIVDSQYEPIMTDLQSAPEDMLKVVKCKCKGSGKSASCTCRKNGIKCLSACQYCRGVLCCNSQPKQPDIETIAHDTECCDADVSFDPLMLDSDLYFIDEEIIDDEIVDHGEVKIKDKDSDKYSSVVKKHVFLTAVFRFGLQVKKQSFFEGSISSSVQFTNQVTSIFDSSIFSSVH